jgi:hypothetical protein
MEPRHCALRVYTLSRAEEIMSNSRCIGFVLAAVMAVCAVSANEMPQRIAPPNRIPDPEPRSLRGQPVATADMPRDVRRAVVADAARRFQVAESSVVLAVAEKLTWSDVSLGCPSPGQVYARRQVPGFSVLAKTSQGALRYHTDMRGQLATCSR